MFRNAGPGDARPTAAEILHDEDMVGNLCGKVILITGCSSGLGIETARALLATGAHVFVTARDTVKGQEVVRDLTESTSASGRISLLSLDLNSLESVRACAKEFLQRSNQLNILITNAGMPVSAPDNSYGSILSTALTCMLEQLARHIWHSFKAMCHAASRYCQAHACFCRNALL